MNRTKYLSKTITLPSETPPGQLEHEITLELPFNACTGVAVYEHSDGASAYQIGLSDDNEVFHHLTDKRDWIASEQVSPNERYKNILIPVTGNRMLIRTKHATQTNGALSFEIVFRLEKLPNGRD